jgi:hypothetical protein
MKTKKNSFALASLLVACFMLSGCYREQIRVDEKRAREELIPIEQAKSYQEKFMASRRELEKLVSDTSFLKRSFSLSNAESFNRDMISLLLNQKGADGIRIYLGQDEKGQIKLVLLPVDKEGHDIITILLPNTAAIHVPGIAPAYADVTGGQAGETGQQCPPCTIH